MDMIMMDFRYIKTGFEKKRLKTRLKDNKAF